MDQRIMIKFYSIGPTKIYLVGHARRVHLANIVEAWGFISSQYVQSEVNNVETYIKYQERWNISGKAETPLRTTYRPELDISTKLGPVVASCYMSLVGIIAEGLNYLWN